MDRHIRKNILDLQFQKNLIMASSAMVLLVTYTISITIGVITNQVGSSYVSLGLLIIFSIAIGGLSIFFFIRAVKQMGKIINLLKYL